MLPTIACRHTHRHTNSSTKTPSSSLLSAHSNNIVAKTHLTNKERKSHYDKEKQIRTGWPPPGFLYVAPFHPVSMGAHIVSSAPSQHC